MRKVLEEGPLGCYTAESDLKNFLYWLHICSISVAQPGDHFFFFLDGDQQWQPRCLL